MSFSSPLSYEEVLTFFPQDFETFSLESRWSYIQVDPMHGYVQTSEMAVVLGKRKVVSCITIGCT